MGSAAGGLAAISMGVLALTVQFWAGATHTSGGINYADAWHVQIAVIGWLLTVAGMLLLARASLKGQNELVIEQASSEKVSSLA